MNYITEINAFERWCEIYYLPSLSQLLWYKLMSVFNKSGWSEYLELSNISVMAMIQTGREATMIQARNDLVEAGLIRYEQGKKGSPGRYWMESVVKINMFKNVVHSEVDNVGNTVVKSVVNTVGNSVGNIVGKNEVNNIDIYKYNNKQKQKQRQKQRESFPCVCAHEEKTIKLFEEFWSAYPKQVSRTLAEQAYAELLLTTEGLREEQVVAATKNYAEPCKILKTRDQYVKMAHNWLRDSSWMDYLPGEYHKPESPETKAKGTRFSNFEERSYNMDELEKQLLSSQGGG